MININGKDWLNATAEDVNIVLDTPEFEESFFFEFKSDQVSTHTLAKEVSALANTYAKQEPKSGNIGRKRKK